jgi:hypothetical protein
MKTYGNEIMIHRGESFTIDKFIVNKDGSPYIVSNQLINPHLRISVSDSLYEQEGRYVSNYFLNLSKLPRFVSTIPVDIRSFKSAADGPSLYDSFASMSGLPSGYVGNHKVTYTSNDDALFYCKNDDGTVDYKYRTETGWSDYKFRLLKYFSTDVTSSWRGQNYWYDISLVSGPIIDGKFVRFDVKLPILNPTRLTVLSDLEGD